MLGAVSESGVGVGAHDPSGESCFYWEREAPPPHFDVTSRGARNWCEGSLAGEKAALLEPEPPSFSAPRWGSAARCARCPNRAWAWAPTIPVGGARASYWEREAPPPHFDTTPCGARCLHRSPTACARGPSQSVYSALPLQTASVVVDGGVVSRRTRGAGRFQRRLCPRAS